MIYCHELGLKHLHCKGEKILLVILGTEMSPILLIRQLEGGQKMGYFGRGRGKRFQLNSKIKWFGLFLCISSHRR